jgi:flagellar assembly protein FliH
MLAQVMAFELPSTAGVASELVDQARVDARAVGYAQGWTQGLRDAAASQAAAVAAAHSERDRIVRVNAEEIAHAVQAILRAADGVEQTAVALTDELSDKVLAAAVELATVLLGKELTDPLTRAAAALTRVLDLAPDNQPVTVWLSPADHETVTGPAGAELLSALDAGAVSRLSFELDPALAPGDAKARAAATSIDARLTSAIERLREFAA